MKSIGIICEYNPFHNGHKYHIEQVKKLYPDAIIIAIMSGQFVQRGEPAFINKFIRTEMALDFVDLVVELPQIFALSYADDFAHGGVLVSQLLNLDALSFGSESGDLNTLDISFNQPSRKDIRTGAAYPKLVQTSLKSNDILGHAYLKASKTLHPKLKLIPIKRINNDYTDEILTGEISSATAIRKNYFEGSNIKGTMPKSSLITHAVRWDDFFKLLKYRVISMTTNELSEIYTMYEGLENRLKNVILSVDSFDSLIHLMVSKRYTKSRIQRLLAYVLLNIKEQDVALLKEISAIRVLGMNHAGRNYIKSINDTKLITNINKNNKQHFELELRATNIYNLMSESKMNDFNTPVIYKR